MKCVEDPKNGEIRRVGDILALTLRAKGWQYVSKDKWKRSTDTTWKKASVPANPTNPNKVRRAEMRNHV